MQIGRKIYQWLQMPELVTTPADALRVTFFGIVLGWILHAGLFG